MAKKQRAGTSDKAQYTQYKAKGSFQKNKLKDLEKHRKEHPEDKCALEALNKIRRGVCPYVRNRKSNGHVCKVVTLHNILHKTIPGLKPLSLAEAWRNA